MESIKIGRRTYKINKGDFILFNGACYQFCSGDDITLYMDGFYKIKSVTIPKTTIAKIDLTKLTKATYKNLDYCTRWIFK